MSSKKKSGIAWEVFSVLVIALFVVSFLKINGISDTKSFVNYFRSWSDHLSGCFSDEGLSWNCSKEPNSGSEKSGTKEAGVTSNHNQAPKEGSTLKNPEYLDKLSKIVLAEPNEVKYKRSEWKHWSDQGNSCNTREIALAQQSVKPAEVDKKTCRVLSGEWIDPYSGKVFNNPRDLDIDHVIPLANASRNGGQKWNSEAKEKFANDLSQLLVVSAKENRVKSDSGPGRYMPPNKDYHCKYSKIWVDTALKYELTISKSDKKALEEGLKTCK